MTTPRKFVLLLLLLVAAGSPGCTGEFLFAPDDGATETDPDDPDDPGDSDPDDPGDDDPDMGTMPPVGDCETPRAVFERETWPRAGKAVCTGCHLSGGVAENEGAEFILRDEASIVAEGISLDQFYDENLAAFEAHSDPSDDGAPTFVAKALGELDHGGGAVVDQDSDAYQSLEALVTAFENDDGSECDELGDIDPVDNLELLSPEATLRKATMMLAGRLPTATEREELAGLAEGEALDHIGVLLDPVMQTDAFREWLKYAWNEVFMLRGLWSLDVTFDFFVVSPSDFRARTWGYLDRGALDCTEPWGNVPVWQRFSYESAEVCGNRRFARDYLSRRVAWSLMEGPLELIAWVIQSDRPFTEILTTDVVVMNYYSSVAYYGSARPQENPWVAEHMAGLPVDNLEHPGGSTIESIDLPFLHEFQPMTSVKRNQFAAPRGEPNQWEYRTPAEYPRAGLLTSQLFLTRYPTTDTNVNRHRAWAYFLNFLGVDILALADRRGDPAEAELGSDQPTIDDPNCNVCHDVMDPVAGLFQDFGNDARWRPNAQWPPPDQPNMLGPGNSVVGPDKGQSYDPQDSPMSPLQWLADQTIQDPRFATRMVRHAFVQLTGHEPMEPPADSLEPGYRGRVEAYEAQAQFLAELREGFTASDFDMKWLYKEIIVSPWYRAAGPADSLDVDDPDQVASVASFGDADRLLTPFELHRKVEAIIGRPWPHRSWSMAGTNQRVIDPNAPENDFLLRFNSDNDFRYVDSIYRDMYGGIDFLNNTRRQVRPSSVMSATGRRISNEFACAVVAQDFAVAPGGRALFGGVEPGQSSDDAPQQVRETVERLHRRMLGQLEPAPEAVDATIALYDDVLSAGESALGTGQVATALPPHCAATARQPGQEGAFAPITSDPDYGIRAWMAVVSYLALDSQFQFTW